jgi:ribonucleoside-triphosphate reductase
MCCRLRLDLRELRKKGCGFFGSGESTGSIGVVTLNLPRIAYLSESKEDFYAMLDKYMDIAARSLDIKRKVITKLMDQGMYPYTKRYLGTFDNHFSTIGLVGMNEALENAKWFGGNLISEEGRALAIEILNHMRTRLSDYQEKYGCLFNLEATPAESTTYRFAKHDTEEFGTAIKTAAKNGGAPFYTNSSHLPVGYTDDIFKALEMEDAMQVLYTSGTVFHAFLGERIPDWRSAASLVKKIAYNFKLPYFTMSPTYSVCPEHGYIHGEHFKCPICGHDAEVYSRITGYYRPVRNWNDGKVSEFNSRKTYEPEELKGRETDPSTIPTTVDKVQSPTTPTYCVDCDEHEELVSEQHESELPILLTTSTCPNCRVAKSLLDGANIKYDVWVVDTNAEAAALATKLGIQTAPALVVKDGEEASLYRNLSEIRTFVEEHE